MSDPRIQIARPEETDRKVRGPKRWKPEFPYHWDVDDIVSRRELLHFTVLTSGALFVATGILAALGLTRRPSPSPVLPITRASQVTEGQAVYFYYPGREDQAMLLHLPGGQFVAYSQKCTHLSCAVFYQPGEVRLFCPCHEGSFSPDSGDPIAGPPRRRLPRILLRRDGDVISAVGWEA
jgi:nitrite reductase/ring-hydroxylating ferredoxin subunit